MSDGNQNSPRKHGKDSAWNIILQTITVVVAVVGLVYYFVQDSEKAGMAHTTKAVEASTKESNSQFSSVTLRLDDQDSSIGNLKDDITILRSDMASLFIVIGEEREAFAKELRDERAAFAKEMREDRAANARELREIAGVVYGTAATVNTHLAEHDANKNSEKCPCNDESETRAQNF